MMHNQMILLLQQINKNVKYKLKANFSQKKIKILAITPPKVPTKFYQMLFNSMP